PILAAPAMTWADSTAGRSAGRAQQRRQVAALPDDDVVELEPVGHLPQRRPQRLRRVRVAAARFGEGTGHQQPPGTAVGAQIDAADELAVEQERKDVVPVY